MTQQELIRKALRYIEAALVHQNVNPDLVISNAFYLYDTTTVDCILGMVDALRTFTAPGYVPSPHETCDSSAPWAIRELEKS